jgi:hypothetical protein
MNIKEVLKEIEKRPALYLGSPSILRLSSFLDGYYFACNNYGVTTQDEGVWQEFQDWISKKFNISDNQRWMQIILMASCCDEYQALKEFFRLFEDFLHNHLS